MLLRNIFHLSGIVLVLSACNNGKPTIITNQDNPVDSGSAGPQTEIVEDRPSPLKKTTGQIEDVSISIRYGSPAVKGRQVWGNLVPYNEIWRTGANEATCIEFSKDVLVEGQELKAGKYGLFSIPGDKEWTLIFNSVWDQWGAYDYDSNMDVLRIKTSPRPHSPMAERLDFLLTPDGVLLVWENLEVGFSVKPL